MNTHRVVDSREITVVSCKKLQMVNLGTSRNPGSMLERFLKSIDPSNLRELVFELLWDKYMNDDIASVIDIPAWESIDDALCILARRIRESHPKRRLNVVLSVVVPQSSDLGKVRMGSLFSEFRREGRITLQRFIDHLPPVSYIISLRGVEVHRGICTRAYTPQICLCWEWTDSNDMMKSDLVVSRPLIEKNSCICGVVPIVSVPYPCGCFKVTSSPSAEASQASYVSLACNVPKSCCRR